MTPYQKHIEANHHELRHSPNGINIIVECEQCQLAWQLPHKYQQDQNPVTLYNWMGRLNREIRQASNS